MAHFLVVASGRRGDSTAEFGDFSDRHKVSPHETTRAGRAKANFPEFVFGWAAKRN
jgi:hypothetical protein